MESPLETATDSHRGWTRIWTIGQSGINQKKCPVYKKNQRLWNRTWTGIFRKTLTGIWTVNVTKQSTSIQFRVIHCRGGHRNQIWDIRARHQGTTVVWIKWQGTTLWTKTLPGLSPTRQKKQPNFMNKGLLSSRTGIWTSIITRIIWGEHHKYHFKFVLHHGSMEACKFIHLTNVVYRTPVNFANTYSNYGEQRSLETENG